MQKTLFWQAFLADGGGVGSDFGFGSLAFSLDYLRDSADCVDLDFSAPYYRHYRFVQNDSDCGCVAAYDVGASF